MNTQPSSLWMDRGGPRDPTTVVTRHNLLIHELFPTNGSRPIKKSPYPTQSTDQQFYPLILLLRTRTEEGNVGYWSKTD